MSNFLVTTDTSCDIFRNDLDKLGVPWLPLTFTINGNTYDDNFTTDEEYEGFYKKIKAGAMPTTSQINLFSHKEFFEALIEKGHKKIIHLPLSSGLSATCEAAIGAADEIMKENPETEIFILDTISATQGHGYLVNFAVKMRDEDESFEAAKEALRRIADNLHHWLIVDNLMHLKRGGRVSGPSAYIGSLLQIKPVIVINDKGRLAVVKKCKGLINSYKYVLEMMDVHNFDKSMPVIIAHADSKDMQQTMIKMIEDKYPGVKCLGGWVGPVIGAHTGPNMIGVVFSGSKRLTNK